MKRKNQNTPGRRIAQAIIAQYKPKSVAKMQAALKEVFDPKRRNGKLSWLRTQFTRGKRNHESA